MPSKQQYLPSHRRRHPDGGIKGKMRRRAFGLIEGSPDI